MNFDKVVDRHGTYSSQWDYTADRFGNEKVLPFSISDMDFPIPNGTKEILINTINHGIFGYTRWKNKDLLSAINLWYLKRFFVHIEDDWITYSPTVIFSLSEIIRIKSQRNDGILFFTPAYDGFFKVLHASDRKIYESKLQLKNDGFTIDEEDFEDKIQKVKILVFCSPHNPVGKVWSEKELNYITTMCEKYNVYIISDEIHMDMIFEKKHLPMLKQDYEKIVVITSATKTFNFPALQFSYLVSKDKKLINKFEINLKEKYSLSSCTILGMKATIDVYNNQEKYLQDLKNYIYENYQYLKKFLEENTKLKVSKLEGTYLLWINAEDYSHDFEQLLDIFYNKVYVGIMDGKIYGEQYYLRMNIAASKTKINEGGKRIVAGIKLLEKNIL